MEQPRLKINNQEVGLRNLGDGLFEPKNLTILEEVLRGNYDFGNRNGFFVEKPITLEEPKRYRKIQSFCFVTTENIKREAAMLLKSLRKFHDQPVYVICDKASRKFLNQEKLHYNVFFKLVAEKDELNKIEKEIFEGHKSIANKVHKPAHILKKMDVMNFALENHDNTFFLDSDIIVLENLQEYFASKVVLSPHYYPKQYSAHGFENGFYNAGYIFCASRGFPNFWKHIYLNDSLFFEQECMNRIPDKQKIQTFSREHNVGFWRREEIPTRIKSLHFHITSGVDKNRDANLRELNKNIKDLGLKYMRENGHQDLLDYMNKMTAHRKVAFVHFGKAAGVYINQYMKDTCLRSYEKYLSWHKELNPLAISNRDWNKKELLEIAENASDYSFIQQHHINWDIETVKKFKENGWFMFTFLRRPEELLCSLHHWAKEISIQLSDHLPDSESLEQTFEYALEDDDFSKLWKIPEYIDLLDYAAEFNDKNFGDFLLHHFGVEHEPREKSNTSKNKGFVHYREKGEISDKIAWQFLKHPEYERFLTYL